MAALVLGLAASPTLMAAQFAYPDGTIGSTADYTFTTDGHWQDVGEGATPDDNDFIQTTSNPGTIEFSLTNTISDPGVDTGHILRFRAINSSNNNKSVTISLYEGASLVGENAIQVPKNTNAWTAYSYTIPSAAVSVYDDLSIRISGNGTVPAPVQISWIALETPDAAAAVPPTVDTPTFASVTDTTAILGGTVSSDGGATVTDRGTVWNTSPNPTLANNPLSEGSGTGPFSHLRSSLPPDTTIYFRAYATNSEGTSYSADGTFTTPPTPVAPTVDTPTFASVTDTTAILGGTVSDDGGAAVTDRGTVWSTSPNPTLANNPLSEGSGTGTFSHLRSSLPPDTTIYFRAYATNSVGTSYSADGSFTTLPAASTPTVDTPTFASVTATTAVLGGTVSDDGGSPVTARGTVWSTSPNPTLANNPLSQGSGTGTFSHLRSGLPPGTLIYFRAYATNSAGTAYSADGSFTTLVAPPTVGSPTVANITATTADLGGTVSDDGGGTVTDRGTVWSTSPNPTLADNPLSEGSGTGSFSHLRTGLPTDTLVYFRAYATNSAGTAYSSDATFTPTAAATVPQLDLPTATSISYNYATLGGTITSDGGQAITGRGTVWGTSPGNTDNPVNEGGTATGAFSHVRTGMPSNSQIYYRAYATNNLGTGYSPEGSFTTGTEPIVQASNVQFTQIAARSFRITWTRGDGEGSMLVLRLQATGRTDPNDGDDYTANPDFTLAPELPVSSQNYVVYKGTTSTVVVNGLTASTSYTAAVYEYAGTGAGTDYLLGPAEATASTNATPVHNLDYGLDCTDCHNNHGNFVPRDAAQQTMCETCHNESGPASGKLDFALHLPPDSNPSQDFVDCGSCHELHNPGVDDTTVSTHPITLATQPNLSYVRANVDKYVPTAQTPAAAHSLPDDYAIENGDDSTSRGVCQACHTMTGNYTNNPGTSGSEQCHDGASNDSCFVQVNCTVCHTHTNQFSPQGGDCLGCHSSPRGSREAIVPMFSRLSHHVSGTLAATDCEVCHAQDGAGATSHIHMDGNVTLWNVDDHTADAFQLGNLADPLVDDGEADKIEDFCLGCHDADGAVAEGGNALTPFTGSGAPPVIDSSSWVGASHNRDFSSFPASPVTCLGDGDNGCHGSGHGSEKIRILTPPDTAATSPEFAEQKEGLCFNCHDNNGPSSIDIEALFTLAPDYQVTSASGALVNQRHDVIYADQQYSGGVVTCVNCHNPHANNNSNPVLDPDDGLPLGTYSPTNVYTDDGHNLAYGAAGNRDPTNPAGSSGGNSEPDYIQFCLTCHDGTTPSGVTMSANMVNMAVAYVSDQHGLGLGSTGAQTGKGHLKQPWTTAAEFAAGEDPANQYAAINCNTCHGPHGTGNIFNLRHSINVAGTQMSLGGPDSGSEFFEFSGQTTYTLPEDAGNQTDHRWGAWCTFCHNMNGHRGVDETTDCTSGHMHGENAF